MKNGEFKIERGVKIPKQTRPKSKVRLLMESMKPGESIFFDKDVDCKTADQRAFAAFGVGNYTRRTVDGGIRIWRTK